MKPTSLSASAIRFALAALLTTWAGAGVRPAAAAARTGEDNATRRVALVIGSHEGGKGRERLVYAASDAFAFRRTLEELGGLKAGDATLLIDPDSVRILRALDDMEARTRELKRSGTRVEAVVYYSGHADENGLRLGEEGMDYRTFRTRLNNLGADVRIAVVDACESGALTRMKGGRSAPAFLVDQSTRSEGYAILTSSSENEAAQESDRVGGSYFTHALNTGLRGAADASRDGKVTLHEAYQFAYNETLERTQSTRGGPQHAGYDIQLTGSGDVVLTDIRQASAFLELSKDLQGRLFIRDSAENLAAELMKPAGSEMRLGLSSGSYGLRLLQGDRWSAATVLLEEGRSARVIPSMFSAVGAGDAAANGPDSSAIAAVPGVTQDSDGFHHVPPRESGGFSSALLYASENGPWHGTLLGPLATDARSHLRGGEISIGVNVTRGDLEGYQAAVGANIVASSLHGAQFSEINIVSDDLEGAQLGSVLGITGENVRGVQGSGVFNIAGGRVKGWQGAGVFNIAGGDTRGAQLAGVFNITGNGVKGVQGAGVFNFANGDVRGVQGSGIFNGSFGAVRGVQGAGVFNVAKSLRGTQLASILNVAGKANGYQIGLINLSDEYESGVPIGLINVSRKGSFEGEGWMEETGLVFTGLRTGANWMHSHFAVGFKPDGDQRMLAPTLGLSGDHAFAGTPLFLETGLLYSSLYALKKYSVENPARDFSLESDWGRVRLGLGIKPLSFVSLVGGISYNAIVHPFSDEPITGTHYRYLYTFNDVVTIWPGAWAGVRIGK